jgi:hypothetical protein
MRVLGTLGAREFANACGVLSELNMRVLKDNAERIVAGSGANANEPPLLDEEEVTAFRQCQRNNQRLEQELLLQAYVDATFDVEFGR